MRITLDATPLLGPRTGIGRYTERLVAELPAAASRAGVELDLRLSTWTLRGGRLTDLPAGVHQVGRPVPARALRTAWSHASFPRVETLVGATDVFHGTNFVSPPTRHAAEVVTIHDLTYERHRDTVSPADLAYGRLVRRALDRGAHVVTPSAHVAAQLRELYDLAPHRTTVTPLGVGPAWFDVQPSTTAWRAAHGITDDYVVFVGTLGRRKNLVRLVEAFVAARPHDVTLVLAGPAGRTRDLDVPGVVPTGWLEDDELRSLVAGARLLALPSLDEGFGLPVLEALAAGRPVLASDIPVLHEVTGPHAVHVDPLDTDAIAAGLVAALALPDDPAAREERRAWARRFSWGATAARTLEAYQALAA